jgi:hypothetical protein
MRSIKLALQFLLQDGWSPEWRNGNLIKWCIHDVLVQADGLDGYGEAVELLSDAVCEDVFDWERVPSRTEADVVGLFQRVIDRG